MTVKKQFQTLKENWLLALLVLLVLGFMSGGGDVVSSFSGGYAKGGAMYDMAVAESAPMMARSYMPHGGDDFAPEVEERKKTYSGSVSTEVERGTFNENKGRFMTVVDASGAYLLDENVNKHGPAGHQSLSGYFRLKVESSKYSSVMSQLKEIGEVTSARDNVDDITGQYVSVEADLEVEKQRLVRYKAMYEEAERVEDKINLNDRIFNQERRIKYLEERLQNMDKQVSYSTITFSMSEKSSDWANIFFVKLSDLVREFVGSVNSVLKTLFVLIPWALAVGLIWLVYRLFNRKRN